MNQIKVFVLFFLTMALAATAGAQSMKGWEVGGWLGGSNYFGDLNTEWRLNRTHIAGGANALYNFNDRLALKFGFAYGEVSAYDSDSRNVFEQTRNLHFRSNVFDLSAVMEFNFLPYVHGSRDYYYTPYVFVGPAFYHFNPMSQLNGTWYKPAGIWYRRAIPR